MIIIYTVSPNTTITKDLIKSIIEYNNNLSKKYTKLKNYYLGKHDVLSRSKKHTLINNRIVVNHAKYITDTNVGYLMGNPVDYQTTDNYDITEILNAYKSQTINDLDVEIAKNVSISGVQHEYLYIGDNAEPKSCIIDNTNSIIVYDNTVQHKKMFGLYYRPVYDGEKIIHYEVLYCDKEKVVTYICNDTILKAENEQLHAFGDVPMIEYRNNPDLQGDFEPVISLIDAYNVLQSDRVNDKEQLVDAVLCMYGVDFTSEQADSLRESRMISDIPVDAKIEYISKTLQEADVDILRQNIESDIHKISMVPNMADTNFVGNSSGVAIRYKLLAFEQNIKNKERYFEKGLMERFRLYNNFLNTTKSIQIVPIEQVDAVFKRNLPSNDYEISQMINNLTDVIDTETLIAQLSFVKNAKEIVELKKQEDKENQPIEKYTNLLSSNQIIDQNNTFGAE